jgi:hypothetical protein
MACSIAICLRMAPCRWIGCAHGALLRFLFAHATANSRRYSCLFSAERPPSAHSAFSRIAWRSCLFQDDHSNHNLAPAGSTSYVPLHMSRAQSPLKREASVKSITFPPSPTIIQQPPSILPPVNTVLQRRFFRQSSASAGPRNRQILSPRSFRLIKV